MWAWPGTRHGLNFVQSALEPTQEPVQCMLTVRVTGPLFVAFMLLPQRSCLLALVGPFSLPSHSLHPMLQPTKNYKQV